MEIHSESIICHQRDRVFSAYRDNLADVAKFIPDIAYIKVLSREEEGEVTQLHNEWKSNKDVPSVAKKVIKPEHLFWDDFAKWDASAFECQWKIQTRTMKDAVQCAGQNQFVDLGDKTKVVLTGSLTINLRDIPGVPSFLAKRLAPSIEKFIVSLITPNLEKVNEALGLYLDAQGDSE